MNFYINDKILLNLYIHSLSFFLVLKDGILKKPGNKFRPKGYNKVNPKLVKVFFINVI